MFVNLVKKCSTSKNGKFISAFYNQRGFVRRCSIRSYSNEETSKILYNGGNLSYKHHIGKEPLFYRTMGQALSIAAERFGDKECLISIHEQERYTYQQINEKVTQIASGLLSSGFERGDRIAMWAPNNVHWLLTAFAAARAGLISVGMNPAYQVSEMEFCINKVGIKGIVAPETFKTQRYYKMIEELAPDLSKSQPGKLSSSKIPSLKTVIIASESSLPGAYNFIDLASLSTPESNQKLLELQNVIQPDDGCNIQFTSGTTGQPKGTLLSHYNLVNNGYHVGARNELAGSQHRICVQVPFFHAYGLVNTTLAAIQHGATLVLPGPSFKPKDSIEAIEKEKCTFIVGTPTMYVDVISKQKEVNATLDSLEIAVTGGAPCSPHLFNQIKEVLNVKQVKSLFGLTETTAVAFQSLPGESPDLTTSTVGHVQDHTEVKVIDEIGNIVPFGTPGELCVRNYGTMLYYWDEPKKTADMIGPDKWLKTGDQFVLEQNGYGRIVGRLKDMIIRGGENIFPKEIEDFINTHPDILETHVIGIADERMGEEVCAVIRLKEGKTLTQPELKEFCKGKIAHFKIPRYLQVTDSLPKTQSGKIQKFKLKKQIESSLINN